MRFGSRVVASITFGLVVGMPQVQAHDIAIEMAAAADRFLESLENEARTDALIAFDDAERENWHFVPRSRRGVALKQMNDSQVQLVDSLLETGLSPGGLARTKAIVSMESVLRELENGAAWRDPGLYFVTVFGTPGAGRPWGWRFEGHHISYNFTIGENGAVRFTPSFLGANPAEVPDGPRKGERALREEDDLARALVKSLSGEHRRMAVFSTRAPRDIITGARRSVEPLEPAGVALGALAPGEREQLMRLLRVYVSRWRSELEKETFERIEAASVERITFAWAGGFERGEANYYRIQGPTFLIEFDNTQNDANHIHTTFREFDGDFGRDLLREHHLAAHGPP